MKTLLIALALLSSSVSAQEIFATAANNSGGKIVLLSAAGKCPKGQASMFAADPEGKIWRGCWKMVGSYVSTKYTDGVTRMYDGDLFTLTDFYQKKFEPVKYQ
jgi:hypothetical protein